jgi:membrane associated rhomboid family serine protease
MNSVAARDGEWWRLFTATTLHADLAHLAANLTLGFLLLGLAMARWRAGPSLLSVLLAGAAGNLASLLASPAPHSSLGASGMVMGALGLLAAGALLPHPAGFDWRAVGRSLGGGALLFILLGLNPASDVVAHLGGFLAGLALGTILARVPERARGRPWFGRLTGACAGGTLLVTWALALTR